ncbi:MAG: Holliday junction resolvase RuvX [Candidatus Pacebacteria bacterium]|nr:Holliday junction resolvase RuvX [Candidatus Paceibacterota bacterium]
MTILGIDYGSKRVGTALSDTGEVLAFPHEIFENQKNLTERIKELAIEKKVRMIVLGRSNNSQGAENPIMEDIKTFKAKLEASVGLPVMFQDEYFSSEEARRYQGNKEYIDASAAALILQRFLDTMRAQNV